MNIIEYTKRIGYTDKLSVDADCLRRLHRCHLMSVPFEGLDIHLNNPISLELNDIYNKVIKDKRGGFCYELNYLFYSFLNTVGFDCTMVSTRLYQKGVYGPEYDHMSIIVKLKDRWLVDVAHGDLFLEPLQVDTSIIQQGDFKAHKMEQLSESEFLLWESRKEPLELKKKYTFSLLSRSIDEFSELCDFKQYSPDSHFVKNVICTIPTSYGRKTLFNKVYKEKHEHHVVETPVVDNAHLREILKKEFNISLTDSMKSIF